MHSNMKKAIIIIAAALSCCILFSSAKPQKDIKRVVYVTDLDCEHCAIKIRENIAYEKGVKDLKVDTKYKTVEVKFDARKNDTLSLRKAINKLGYSAKVVEFQ